MRLTQENAHLYEGKVLYAERKLFHYYPLYVKRNMLGELMVCDSVGVWERIPPESDLFNRIDFDYAIKEDTEKC